jgi:CHAT domain-containing protein
MAQWAQGLAWLHYDPRRALAHLQAARTYYRAREMRYEEGRILIGVAGMMGQLGLLEEAEQTLALLKEYLRPYPDYPGWPGVYLNEADIHRRSGRYRRMITAARKAEQLAQQYDNRAIEATALINQSVGHMMLGEYDPPAGMLLRAYAIAQESGYSLTKGWALINLARLHTAQEQFVRGLHDLEEAQRIFAAEGVTLDEATVALEKTRLFIALQMWREALQTAVFAAEQFQRAGVLLESAEAYIFAIRLALQQGKGTKARQLIKAAATAAAGASPVEQALLQAYRAHPRLQKGAAERRQAQRQAAAAAETLAAAGAVREQLEARLLAVSLQDDLSLATPPAPFEAIAAEAERYNYLGLAVEAYLAAAGRRPLPEQAAPLQKAAHIVARQRRQMSVEELKATLLSGRLPVYRRLAEAQLRTGTPAAALQTMLAAKGGVWSDLAQLPPSAPSDPAWLQARAALTQWQDKRQEASGANQEIYRQKVQEAEMRLAALSRLRERRRPLTPLPTVEAIRAAIPANVVVVEYLVGEQTLYACLLTRQDAPVWVELGERKRAGRLLSRLNLMLRALQTAVPAQRRQRARAQEAGLKKVLRGLYDTLLAPLPLPTGTPLILVPDDFLFAVPWAALWTGERYAGERHTIATMPSAVTPGLPQTAVSAGNSTLLLGYAGDPPLPYVEQELAEIAAVTPAAKQVLPASSADLVWERPYRYLHIAAHGQAQAQEPILSRLWLADGPYLLADAIHLPLHGTELVTLSACDTGTMPERGGIALALSGAFLMAGAQAVVSSLWPVDDAATRLFMRHFYAALAQGTALPAGVQQAQRQLLSGDYAHPFYWAAFQPMMRRL